MRDSSDGSHEPEVFLTTRVGSGPAPGLQRVRDEPFQIVVVGDFSVRRYGGTSETPAAVSAREPIRVTSVDDLMSRVRPTLELPLSHGEAPSGATTFESLEDFEPERLVESVPDLGRLFSSIDDIVSSASGRSPADDARSVEQDADPRPPRTQAPVEAPAAGLLDSVLAATPESTPQRGPLDELEPWIRRLVAGHLVREDSPREEQLREGLRAAANEELSSVMRSDALRDLEAVWRSLDFLVTRVDPTGGVRIFVLDLGRKELEDDLSGDLSTSSLLRRLSAPLPGPGGDTPPGLIVGAYRFGRDPSDLGVLNRLCMLAELLGTPWISGAKPDLVGATSFAGQPYPADWISPEGELWDMLRATPAAGSVGLVAPAFLLRQPYAEGGLETRLPGFRECGADAGPGEYLWGNPAFVCAVVVAEEFNATGWGLRPGAARDLEGLPIHTRPDGSVGAHPTEVIWTVDAAERVAASGVMPFTGFRESTRARLRTVASIALPPAPLAAWWAP